jgi:phosphoribosyl-AMP cyclohydrolase
MRSSETVEPNFDKSGGLIPVIVQDDETGEVLMLAYMNREAWLKTLETGKATYWSRSRGTLWVKGETSGHTQLVRDIMIDCDEDTILLRIEQIGGTACHTGHRSCFYRRLADGKVQVISDNALKQEDIVT